MRSHAGDQRDIHMATSSLQEFYISPGEFLLNSLPIWKDFKSKLSFNQFDIVSFRACFHSLDANWLFQKVLGTNKSCWFLVPLIIVVVLYFSIVMLVLFFCLVLWSFLCSFFDLQPLRLKRSIFVYHFSHFRLIATRTVSCTCLKHVDK